MCIRFSDANANGIVCSTPDQTKLVSVSERLTLMIHGLHCLQSSMPEYHH